MSSLTRCNFCTLERMREIAAARGAGVVVERAPAGTAMEGWISASYSDQDKPTAYFLALTEGCVC